MSTKKDRPDTKYAKFNRAVLYELAAITIDSEKLVWYTRGTLGNRHDMYGKECKIEFCRNCGEKGLHAEFAAGELVGSLVDSNTYIHVTHNTGEPLGCITTMSSCSLNPVTGFWERYTNPIFEVQLNKALAQLDSK